MKLTNLGYLLKEGIKGIFTHGFMSFAAVCVTVACLLIVGSFSILVYNVNIMVEELNQTNEILAYVDETLSDADAKSVGTKINMIDNVLRSDFIPREQALDAFIEDHKGEEESFSGLDATDLRHRFRVILEDNRLIKETDEALKNIPGVVKTHAEYELAEGFSTIQDVLHIVSLGIIAVLLAVSLLIISNTVKLANYVNTGRQQFPCFCNNCCRHQYAWTFSKRNNAVFFHTNFQLYYCLHLFVFVPVFCYRKYCSRQNRTY